jgi:hypothetical protein
LFQIGFAAAIHWIDEPRQKIDLRDFIISGRNDLLNQRSFACPLQGLVCLRCGEVYVLKKEKGGCGSIRAMDLNKRDAD